MGDCAAAWTPRYILAKAQSRPGPCWEYAHREGFGQGEHGLCIHYDFNSKMIHLLKECHLQQHGWT